VVVGVKRRSVAWLPLIHPFWERLFRLRLATMLALTADAAPGLAAAAFTHLGATAPTARAARWTDSLSAQLASGKDLLRAVQETMPVPPRVAAMLELGSRTGNLAGARAYIYEWCDTEFDEALPRFEANMLIATYVLIGVTLATVVMALYLPIFRLGAAV